MLVTTSLSIKNKWTFFKVIIGKLFLFCFVVVAVVFTYDAEVFFTLKKQCTADKGLSLCFVDGLNVLQVFLACVSGTICLATTVIAARAVCCKGPNVQGSVLLNQPSNFSFIEDSGFKLQ